MSRQRSALLCEVEGAQVTRVLAVAGQAVGDVLSTSGVLEALRRDKHVEVRLLADRAKGMLAGAILIEDIMTIGGYLTPTICARGVVHGLLVYDTFGEALPS